MRSGKLRHRVTIQQLVSGSPQQLPSGEPDSDWADVKTVWAAVRPLSGRELLAAQQIQSTVEVEIEIRYRSDLSGAMRAKHGTVIYDVQAVIDPEERHERLLLRCSRGANQG